MSFPSKFSIDNNTFSMMKRDIVIKKPSKHYYKEKQTSIEIEGSELSRSLIQEKSVKTNNDFDHIIVRNKDFNKTLIIGNSQQSKINKANVSNNRILLTDYMEESDIKISQPLKVKNKPVIKSKYNQII